MSSRAGFRLLTIGDDAERMHSIVEFVRKQRFEAFAVSNYLDALDAFRYFAPDIVVLDSHLGGINTLPLLAELREMNPELWVPKLLICDDNRPEMIARGFANGADDVLFKHFPIELLHGKLRLICRAVQLQREVDAARLDLAHYADAKESESLFALQLYERLLSRGRQAIHGIKTRLIPAEMFSGDMILYHADAHGECYALLADATGHGLVAAICLMPVTQAFLAMTDKHLPLPAIVSEMNQQLRRMVSADRYVAAAVIHLSCTHKRLQIWNGGIPNVHWLNPGQGVVKSFRSQHMALGMVNDAEFEADCENYEWTDDGALLIASDGLNETDNNQAQYFGRERLKDLLYGVALDDTLDVIQNALLIHADGKAFNDDVSMLLINSAQLSSNCLMPVN